MAVTYENLGQIFYERDPDESAKMFRQGIRILRKLSAEQPEVAQLSRSLAFSSQSLAALLLEQLGAAEESRNMFEESLELRRDLMRRYPGEMLYEDDLLAALRSTADTCFDHHQDEFALACYWEMNSLADKLSKDAPDRMDLQARLLNSFDGVVRVHLRSGALARAIEIYEPLTALERKHIDHGLAYEKARDPLLKNPPISLFQSRFSRTQFQFASIFDRAERFDQSLLCLRLSTEMLEEVVSPEPKGISQRRSLARRLVAMARLLSIKEQMDEVESTSRRAVSLISGVPIQNRSDVDWVLLGQAYVYLQQWEDARSALNNVCDISDVDETTANDDPRWWYYIMSLANLGETEAAQQYFRVLTAHPKTGQHRYNLSWYESETRRVLQLDSDHP